MAEKLAPDETQGLTPGVIPDEPPRPSDGQGPSTCHVVYEGGADKVAFTTETAESLLAADRFFWLDL